MIFIKFYLGADVWILRCTGLVQHYKRLVEVRSLSRRLQRTSRGTYKNRRIHCLRRRIHPTKIVYIF